MKKIIDVEWNVLIAKDEGLFFWTASLYKMDAGVNFLVSNKNFSTARLARDNWNLFAKINNIRTYILDI